MSLDRTIFFVYRNAGKIPHMLIRTRELVKQGRLAAVLISNQRKMQNGTGRKRIPVSFGMINPVFAESRMMGRLYFLNAFMEIAAFPDRLAT